MNDAAVYHHRKRWISQGGDFRKRPLQGACQGGSPGNTYLYCSSAYDMQGVNERSFEQVSKDKPAIRRRAAFDSSKKDVTKKDVKTPPSS